MKNHVASEDTFMRLCMGVSPKGFVKNGVAFVKLPSGDIPLKGYAELLVRLKEDKAC